MRADANHFLHCYDFENHMLTHGAVTMVYQGRPQPGLGDGIARQLNRAMP
jgi:hypothetical protein